MTRKRTPAPTYIRQTITAGNTLESHTVALDALGEAALHYATAWAADRYGLKPRCSVLLRLALARYVHSLDGITTPEDEKAELWALKAAGNGAGSATWLDQARQRLAAHGTQSFAAVRWSAEELRQQRELMKAVEHLQ